MTGRLRLGLVLAGLFLLVGAGNLADSSTAAETSAEPSAPASAAPASTTPAWAPSLKGATFKSRRPDAGADLVASASQEPFAGKFAAPALRMPDSSATGSAPGGTSLTTGAHKGLLCSDCHASSVSLPAEGQPAEGLPAQDQDRPELKWSTRYTASVPPMRVYSSHLTELLGLDISQPDGSSRVCVGCHAMTDKISRPENRFGPDDLARTHPVSFTYDGGLAMRARRAGLRDPATAPSGLGGTIAGDLLDSRGKVQCSSCHDAHGPGRGPKLMRFPYDKTTSQGSNLCRICHNK